MEETRPGRALSPRREHPKDGAIRIRYLTRPAFLDQGYLLCLPTRQVHVLDGIRTFGSDCRSEKQRLPTMLPIDLAELHAGRSDPASSAEKQQQTRVRRSSMAFCAGHQLEGIRLRPRQAAEPVAFERVDSRW